MHPILQVYVIRFYNLTELDTCVNDISEDPKNTPIKRRYTGARDLRAVSQKWIVGEPSQGIRTRSSLRTESNLALISEIQPESVDKALQDQSWVEEMKEELNQSVEEQSLEYGSLPKGHSIIGTK